MAETDITEREATARSGISIVGVIVALVLVGLLLLGGAAAAATAGQPVVAVLVGVLGGLCWLAVGVSLFGFYMVQPNKAAVLALFGDYRGTDHHPGLRWANPLYTSRTISLRVRNFTTHTSKVNDARGNPIEIAAVVVWRVRDTALALYRVDDYVEYVHTQAESAVRHIAREYPYDAFNDEPGEAIPFDADRKMTFASNLMTVIVSEAPTNPVVNVGTLNRQDTASVATERKKYLLRIPQELYDVYEEWADDELRSVNAQIEAVLTDAARRSGRLRQPKPQRLHTNDDSP